MRVKVAKGVQVKHGGKMYADGASFDVNDNDAEDLIRRGWVTETKAVTSSANKAVTSAETPNKAAKKTAKKR